MFDRWLPLQSLKTHSQGYQIHQNTHQHTFTEFSIVWCRNWAFSEWS